MSFLDKSLLDFISEVDSKQPTPGGGSVSALSAVLGVSLGRMVGHVTIGRKAFQRLDENKQQDILEAFEELAVIKERLLPLIDKDTEAFNQIMLAYRLPKDTPAQEEARTEAIQSATIGAIDVPLMVAELSLDAIKLLDPIARYGNRNAISDIGVANHELHIAILGALMNVEINLSGLTDKPLQQQYQDKATHIKGILLERSRDVSAIVQSRM